MRCLGLGVALLSCLVAEPPCLLFTVGTEEGEDTADSLLSSFDAVSDPPEPELTPLKKKTDNMNTNTLL